MKHYGEILYRHFLSTTPWSDLTVNQKINRRAEILATFEWEYKNLFQ